MMWMGGPKCHSGEVRLFSVGDFIYIDQSVFWPSFTSVYQERMFLLVAKKTTSGDSRASYQQVRSPVKTTTDQS